MEDFRGEVYSKETNTEKKKYSNYFYYLNFRRKIIYLFK